MAQTKMQTYMDRHKLGALFEDLMNRVVRDMPEEPMVYLLRTLYKKAGLEIPQEIRYGGLRKSVDIGRSRSPERARSAQNPVDPNSMAASREYEKPWLTHQRRMKPRRSTEDPDALSTKTGKKKPDWQTDTKIVATSFDDLWEDHAPQSREVPSPGKKAKTKTAPLSNWAAVGLEGAETFTSGDYQGPRQHACQGQQDLLAAEMMRSFGRDADDATQPPPPASLARVRGQKVDSERHRRQLESMVQSDAQTVNQTPSTRPDLSDGEDDALELLEDAEDLKREGVKNIPTSGYKLSKIMRERTNENVVKLNINLSPRAGGMKVSDSMQSFEGYESDRENASPAGGRWESEDEFESVSQVVGPRRPVWNDIDSDGEARTARNKHKQRRKQQSRGQDLSASAPDPLRHLTLTANDLDLPVNQTWSAGLRVQTEDSSPDLEGQTDLTTARSGGWMVPDDSDAASVQDWNQRVKGRKRDPRSY